MKSYRKNSGLIYPTRRAFINITQVREALAESGIKEGLCLVNAMHITASVFINDNESGLHHDYEKWLEDWRRMNGQPVPSQLTGRKTMPMPI